LHQIIRLAQRACPTIALPPDVFAAYLGDRVPSDVPAVAALRQMHTIDLYLACACARGDVRAFEAFDELCLRRLDRVLRTMRIDADAIEEIKQDIRSRVLIGDGGRAAIVDFSGRGDLRGWVRVMAVRLALQRLRRTHREESIEDDAMLERLVAPHDTELDYAKGIYRQEFKRAFQSALRALPVRERTLLRQHYIDALTVDQLGTLYRVHRSTAARLLERARHALLDDTRARMLSQLGLQPGDLDSILRMIRSQLEISWPVIRRR
jgi:RNA polymerase sigma-70 factor (ECF subfamily)